MDRFTCCVCDRQVTSALRATFPQFRKLRHKLFGSQGCWLGTQKVWIVITHLKLSVPKIKFLILAPNPLLPPLFPPGWWQNPVSQLCLPCWQTPPSFSRLSEHPFASASLPVSSRHCHHCSGSHRASPGGLVAFIMAVMPESWRKEVIKDMLYHGKGMAIRVWTSNFA